MASHNMVWPSRIIILIMILFYIFNIIVVSVSEEAIAWPPPGTRAVYTCFVLSEPIVVSSMSVSMPGLFKKLYEYLRREGLLEFDAGKPDPVFAFLGLSNLWERNATLGCTLEYIVESFNGTHYIVKVRLQLEVREFRPRTLERLLDEPLTVLGSVEKELVVSASDRSMYSLDGEYLGVWPLFLFPWELGEGVRVKLTAGLFYPESLREYFPTSATLGRATVLASDVRELASRLEIPRERLLKGGKTVVFLLSTLPAEARESYREKFRYAVVYDEPTLEDVYQAYKAEFGCDANVTKKSLPELAPYSVGSVVVDSATGLVVYLGGVNDLLGIAFGLFKPGPQTFCPIFTSDLFELYLVDYTFPKPQGSSTTTGSQRASAGQSVQAPRGIPGPESTTPTPQESLAVSSSQGGVGLTTVEEIIIAGMAALLAVAGLALLRRGRRGV